MSRLTKNVSDKQIYCGYEVKDCKYQQIYGFKKYSELEDYVDCDLTLAIDKLGKLENLEEELGCPLDVYVKATIDGIIVDDEWFSVEIHKDNNGYYFKLSNGSCFPFYLKNYKKSWWLRKDKSE